MNVVQVSHQEWLDRHGLHDIFDLQLAQLSLNRAFDNGLAEKWVLDYALGYKKWWHATIYVTNAADLLAQIDAWLEGCEQHGF